MHVSVGESPTTVPAFARFRKGLDERCEEPPRVVSEVVGTYGLSAQDGS